ncbi:MAG: rod-binding protein [Planctomycetaceae bacterium]|nr:rod-binding protein [Planctomycetaceae bacterium]
MSLSSISAGSQDAFAVSQLQASQAAKKPESLTTEQAFQDFVAGTFFSMMLKALRSTQSEVQYMSGGKAEETFRGQLDQQIASDLASEHGKAFSDPLYPNFQSYLEASSPVEGAQLEYLA